MANKKRLKISAFMSTTTTTSTWIRSCTSTQHLFVVPNPKIKITKKRWRRRGMSHSIRSYSWQAKSIHTWGKISVNMHTGWQKLSLSSSSPPSEYGIYVHSKLSPQLYCWRQCSLWPGYPEFVFAIFGLTAQNNICSVTFNVQREIETAHTHWTSECFIYTCKCTIDAE